MIAAGTFAACAGHWLPGRPERLAAVLDAAVLRHARASALPTSATSRCTRQPRGSWAESATSAAGTWRSRWSSACSGWRSPRRWPGAATGSARPQSPATTGLLVSPISWTHHWVWIMPALIVLLRGGGGAPDRRGVRLRAVRAGPDVVDAAPGRGSRVRLPRADDSDGELLPDRRTRVPGVHGLVCLAGPPVEL